MKAVVDRLFHGQNPGAMSLSRPAPAKPTSPSQSREAASEQDHAGASSPPSISSTSSKPMAALDVRAALPIISPASTSSFSTNSAISPLPRPAANYCSTSSAGSTSAPQ